MNNIITLANGLGIDVQFEFLDLISLNGEDFVVLLPVGAEDGEVVILRIEGESSNLESYVSVEDEDILMTVFSIFKDRWKSKFDFVDE